ncbi:uncharacterized protein LOC143914180 [Arctopsyche grandis]|uniref:uncharacterized protein LOC143914180 n=1 Tax=Arctopsyche grandis TaxID=121162 RepID=UPI00406D6F65
MAAAAAVVDRGRSPSTDASARSMQHFLVQESFCAASTNHTDTDIADLLQEISRLQADGNHSEHNTDRDIEDIISEAETLVSERSNKIDLAPASTSTSTSSSLVKRDTYLPYRTLLRHNTNLKKAKQSHSKSGPDTKREMPKQNDVLPNQVKSADAVSSDDIDVKAILANKIPSRESLNVSDERFASSFLQINEVSNSAEPVQSSKPKQPDAVQKKLNVVLDELKDAKEKLKSVQVQCELATGSCKELKKSNEDFSREKKALELKTLEKDNIIVKLRKDLELSKSKSSKFEEDVTRLKDDAARLKDEKQNLTAQVNKDKATIQDLQRQCKEMDGILTRKHPDSVSALIVASKQPSFELETKKLLEKRISELENDLKMEEERYQKTLSNIQGKVNSMKENYETHIGDLEKQVINLQLINSEIKEKIKHRDFNELSTQTGTNNISVAVQTLNARPTSGKAKNQNAATSNSNVHAKDDSHLMATVRGLNSELVLKEKHVSKLNKELDEAKRLVQKLQKTKDSGAVAKVQTVEKPNVRKSRPASVKVMRISTDVLNNNSAPNKQEKDKVNSKTEMAALQKDFENLKKKRIDDLVELQTSHEKELMSLNLKVLPLQHDVESLNSTVETLRSQIKLMDEQLSTIMTERDHFKCRAEQLNSKLGQTNNVDSNRLGKVNIKTNDRDYDDLRIKVMELEKRYEGREVRLKSLINSLAKIRDAHTGSSILDSGHCTEGSAPSQTYRSC